MGQVDIVIRGGVVIDGTGAEPRRADVNAGREAFAGAGRAG